MPEGSEHAGNGIAPPRRRIALIAGAAVAVVVLVAAAVFGYRTTVQKRGASSEVDAAMAAIEDADRLVARVDGTLSAKVGSETATRAAEASSDAEKARAQLAEAVETIDRASARLPDSERRRAELLADAAESRIDMMSEVPGILAVSRKAATALPKAESAWQSVLEADRLSERAVTQYNKLTRAGVRSSAEFNRRAGESLAAARAGFLQSESAFPESGLEVYVAYVDARISLNRISRRSDAAWLAGDIAKANAFIATYNSQDRSVVARGKKLPSSPSSVIATAFDEATQAGFDAYYEARERATAADARLRSL